MARLTRDTGKSGNSKNLAAVVTTLAFAALVGWNAFAAKGGPTPPPAVGVTEAEMTQRFTADIWPMLKRPGASCVKCHNKDNPSQLHFPSDSAGAFQMLRDDGRFLADNPSSLLARIAAPDSARRMPPSGMPSWSADDQKILSKFMADLATLKKPETTAAGGQHEAADEPFPRALLTPYHGASPRNAAGADNTFLTYFQLRRKIQTLFDDDWFRGGKDMFVENIAQFGGADFVHRYDETTRPTAAYISATGEMARDVAARAYLNKAGPFAGRPDVMPMPGKSSDKAVRDQVSTLYRRMLFRDPSAAEMEEAVALLTSIVQQQKNLVKQTEPVGFAVDVQDERGMRTTKQLKIDMLPPRYGIATHFCDQSAKDSDHEIMPGVYTLSATDTGQKLEIANHDTTGHVSLKSVTLRGPLPDKTETVIGGDDPRVHAEGAWRIYGGHGKDGYDDDNNNKGLSRITVALSVKKTGKYEIEVGWRKRDGGGRRGPESGASGIPVTITTYDPTRLELPPVDPIPPTGEADYIIDQTVDTIKYWDLGTSFQFDSAGENIGVEISNAGTHRRVVADAVSFVPDSAPDGDPAIVVRANDADGHEKWPVYKPNDTIYNIIGPDLRSDENKHKGELKLLFSPGRMIPLDKYYRARITYPGHVDNETQTPVVVHAFRSSPIVRLRAPVEAPIGAKVTLDAASSYNVQHSTLHYNWRQIGGPRVVLSNPHAAVTSFTLPGLEVHQAAWQGLCRALILHPDFLFTRPRSLVTTRNPRTRRRLQLVKIAQDLLGRPPLAAELAKLDAGATLGAMVNAYLASPEFEEFYYRRVRLYLESHGTPSQDEPARLWRYILHNNLPYTGILTADYTISPDGLRHERPSYCGHTGVLTMRGFIEGKPSLPHFNYSAQVCEKFLGYVFEVTPEIVKARGTLTASSTVDPKSLCYTCHQVLTPLAYQRQRWTDDGKYQAKYDGGGDINDSDQNVVASYPFKGNGMEAFAMAAQHTERFNRAIIQTHFIWFFGRELRYDADERGLYKRLWDETRKDHQNIKGLIRTIMTSPEYLGGDAGTKGKSRGVVRYARNRNFLNHGS